MQPLLPEDQSHFKIFGEYLKNHSKVVSKRDSEDFLQLQKKQVEELVKLEKDFKIKLLNHKYGIQTYEKFIYFIRDHRKNILAARPFFRERQTIFTNKIAKALKSRSWQELSKFHFNFNFIRFVMNTRKWNKTSDIYILYNDIIKLRHQLVVMNMPLAVSRARIFYSSTPRSQLSYMDLIQICAEGLMIAIDKFVLPFSRIFRSVAIGRCVGLCIEAYSVDQDTILMTSSETIKYIKDFKVGDKILSVNDFSQVVETEVVALHDNGTKLGFEVTFDNGYQITCSINHKFLTKNGMLPLYEIVNQKLGIYCEQDNEKRWVDSTLSTSVPKETGTRSSQEELSRVSKINNYKQTEMCKIRTDKKHASKWLESKLWKNFSNSNIEGSTLQDLRLLSCNNFNQKSKKGRMEIPLWHSIQDKKLNVQAQQELSTLSNRYYTEVSKVCKNYSNIKNSSCGQMEGALWDGFDEKKRFNCTQKRLSDLSGFYYENTQSKFCSMESQQSRFGSSKYDKCQQNFPSKFKRESQKGQTVFQKSKNSSSKMEKRKLRRIYEQYEKSLVDKKVVENGKLVKEQQNINMGRCSNSLWKKEAQASRFCFSRSQDMDRSRWRIPFFRNVKNQAKTIKDSGARRNVKKRSNSSKRYNVNKAFLSMFSVDRWKNERRLEGMAFENAPLTDTGNLVCRNIVRIRSVGFKRMYDIEVTNPKHNFILPGGIITSNSQPVLHFYPGDKRKIYKANKLINRNREEINYADLSKKINKSIDKVYKTNPIELMNLMAASSFVSSDNEIKNESNNIIKNNMFAAPEDTRPDVRVENKDSYGKLYKSVSKLSVLEQKILKLKGMEI